MVVTVQEQKLRSELSQRYATIALVKGVAKGFLFGSASFLFCYGLYPRLRNIGTTATTGIIVACAAVAGAIQAEHDLLQIEHTFRKSDTDARNKAIALQHYSKG